MKKVLFACLGILICAGCTKDLFKNSEEPVFRKKTWNPEIRKFSSCGEIDAYVQSYRYPEYVSAPMPGQTVSAGQPYENQVDGVLEGDSLQVSSKFFFFTRPGSIEIVTQNPFALYKTLPTEKLSNQWLLYFENKLIYIGSGNQKTSVSVYEVEEDFKKIYDKTFAGSTVDFRLVEGQLRLITETFFKNGQENLDCAQIFRPSLEDGDRTLTFINQVNLGDETITENTTGLMGPANSIYMTSNELLLFTNGGGLPSHFRVVDLKSSLPALVQVKQYEGFIKDRWSVLVKNDTIFIASTVTNKSSFIFDNKIFAYEKMRGIQYELAFETPAFGHREDIRAVRYLEDKAYIVTFEKTDPLFVFDIKDPKDIKLLGALESPGFSTQLRELSNHMMMGLGYKAIAENGFSWFDGLKLSLFDMHDPLKPQEVQAFPWGQRGSYSEATADPKALFVSREKDRILFPVILVEQDEDSHPSDFGKVLQFAGAMIMDFNGKELKEAGRISHQNLREAHCGKNAFYPMTWWSHVNKSLDIQRVIQIQDRIYSFSPLGAMQSDALSYETSKELSFDTSSVDCRSRIL